MLRRLLPAAVVALIVVFTGLQAEAQLPQPGVHPSPFAAAWQVLERRAAPLRPSAADLRYQQIPWLVDPAEALKQARSEGRPMFLWVAGGRDRDGVPLERC
jgi:hypothetical protein